MAKAISPRKQPDLIVPKSSFSPGKPTTADEITFWVFVKMQPSAEAGPSVWSFRARGESMPKRVKIPALNPGKEFRHQNQVPETLSIEYGIHAIEGSGSRPKPFFSSNRGCSSDCKKTAAMVNDCL